MYLLILLSLIAADPIPQNVKDMILNNVCWVEGRSICLTTVFDLEEAWIEWKDAPAEDILKYLRPLDEMLKGNIDDMQKQIYEKAIIIQVLRLRGFEGVENPMGLMRQYWEFLVLNSDAFSVTGLHCIKSVAFSMARETFLELEHGIMGESPDYDGLLSEAESHVIKGIEISRDKDIVVQRLLLRQDPGFLEYVNKTLAEREETDSEPRIWQIIREERTDRKLQHNRGQMLDRLTLMRERKAAGLSPELPPVGP